MAGVISYEDFYAICNHMPGSDRALRAGGTMVVPTDGWSGDLREHEAGTETNLLLRLDLVVTPPSPGTAVAPVVSRIQLDEFRIDHPTVEYYEVDFQLVGDEGGVEPESIKVDHPR